MDRELEEMVEKPDANCITCCPTISLEWPEKPWSRFHIDYAGPSTATVCTLREIFAQHGLPEL